MSEISLTKSAKATCCLVARKHSILVPIVVGPSGGGGRGSSSASPSKNFHSSKRSVFSEVSQRLLGLRCCFPPVLSLMFFCVLLFSGFSSLDDLSWVGVAGFSNMDLLG